MRVVDFTAPTTLKAAVYSDTEVDPLVVFWCPEGSTWCSRYHDKGVMFQEPAEVTGKICTSSEWKKLSPVHMNGLPSLAFHVSVSVIMQHAAWIQKGSSQTWVKELKGHSLALGYANYWEIIDDDFLALSQKEWGVPCDWASCNMESRNYCGAVFILTWGTSAVLLSCLERLCQTNLTNDAYY